MKQDDSKDKWLEEIHSKMVDYQEDIPADGWDRLCADLKTMSVENQSVPTLHKSFVLPLWMRVAAAVILLVVVSGGWYLLSISRVPQLAEALQQSSPEQVLSNSPQYQLPTIQPLAQADLSSTPSIQPSVLQEDFNNEDTESADSLHQQVNSSEQEDHADNSETQTSDTIPQVERYQNDASQLMAQHTATGIVRKKRSGWTFGMNVSGGTVMPSFENDDFLLGPAGSLQEQLNPPAPVDSIQGETTTRSALFPSRRGPNRLIGTNHKMWSVGVSFNKQLNNRWSFETGLVYTLLTSDILLGKGSVPQKLHYVGIPLKLNLALFQSKHWQVYMGGGTMVERCVYATRGNEKLNINALQYSLSANAGIQYRFSSNAGLYVEPGIRYYFDDGTDVSSFRSEHPLSLIVQAGFRFSY